MSPFPREEPHSLLALPHIPVVTPIGHVAHHETGFSAWAFGNNRECFTSWHISAQISSYMHKAAQRIPVVFPWSSRTQEPTVDPHVGGREASQHFQNTEEKQFPLFLDSTWGLFFLFTDSAAFQLPLHVCSSFNINLLTPRLALSHHPTGNVSPAMDGAASFAQSGVGMLSPHMLHVDGAVVGSCCFSQGLFGGW